LEVSPFQKGFIEDFPKTPLITSRQTHVNQGADARTQGGILKTPWTISKFVKGLRSFPISSSSHPQPSHHLFGFSPCFTAFFSGITGVWRKVMREFLRKARIKPLFQKGKPLKKPKMTVLPYFAFYQKSHFSQTSGLFIEKPQKTPQKERFL